MNKAITYEDVASAIKTANIQIKDITILDGLNMGYNLESVTLQQMTKFNQALNKIIALKEFIKQK